MAINSRRADLEQDNAPHVLIVEDDPDMAKMLKMLLEREFSATAEIAEDYASARERLESGTFDIITLDYQLPDGDGLELLGEINEMDSPPPVIMVTGHGDEQTAVESFKQGANGYVVKDKRLSTLFVDAVEHALSDVRLRRAEEALDLERKQLLALFESIDEVIYVVDPESHEILFANKHLKDAFGKELVGGICYRELQELDEPCEFCTNEKIFKNKGKPYSWEYHNPVLDRDYLITDRVIKWPDGRDVRFELAIDITERKEAELALRESERISRAILSHHHQLTGLLSPDGNLLAANAASILFVGVSEEDVLGKPFWETPWWRHSREAQADLKVAIKRAREGEYVQFLTTHENVDGEIREIEFSLNPVMDDKGEVVYLVPEGNDITERKRAERLVTIQRDMAVKLSGISGFHETLEVAIDAILEATVFDCGGVYTLDKESGALELLYDIGLSRDFVEATSHYDADSPSSQLVLEGEALFINYEDIPIPLDDVRRNEGLGAFGIVPVTDEGAVIGCVNVASHISTGEIPDESRAMVETLAGQIGQAIRRARLASALAESEERYRLLYESAGEAIYTHNRDLILTSINPAACEMIGYTKEELLGKNVLEVGILHPEDVEKATRLLGQLLSGEKVISDTVRVIRKDGSVALAKVTLTALYKDGEINEVVNIAHDITERKRAEEEVERINAELEGYAHTVSHDLKGPLSAIMLGVDTLADSLEGIDTGDIEETSEIVAIIGRNARSAQRRTDDLLSLAKSGQEPGETSPVDVGEVVEGILAESSREIKEKGIEVDVSPDLGRIIASPTQIQQVFSNLIGNAFRYNDSENPVIQVSYLGDDEGGAHRYMVRDNGPGIPDDIIDNVFFPFTRGESSDTGIGLSIVEKLVKIYGGQIRAYNNSGACFEFTLKDFY